MMPKPVRGAVDRSRSDPPVPAGVDDPDRWNATIGNQNLGNPLFHRCLFLFERRCPFIDLQGYSVSPIMVEVNNLPSYLQFEVYSGKIISCIFFHELYFIILDLSILFLA